jgi:hypothetical protein
MVNRRKNCPNSDNSPKPSTCDSVVIINNAGESHRVPTTSVWVETAPGCLIKLSEVYSGLASLQKLTGDLQIPKGFPGN